MRIRLSVLAFSSILMVSAHAGTLSGCSYKGIPLYGKVKVVNAFPDIKVKVVRSFPDLKVKRVNGFANQCGQWQFVDAFPDFKVQFVDSFPDIKIQYVDAFPGVR
jgi:hypothetical protein